jgi:AcrR family transcriptional regulator
MGRKGRIDRAAVIEVAAQLVDEAGIAHLALAPVAERLGVRVPSLYNHIASLEDLQLGIAAYSIEQLTNTIINSIIGKSGDDAIRALSVAYREYAKAHPGCYITLNTLTTVEHPELLEKAHPLTYIIAAVLSAYNLHAEDAVHAVRALRSMAHGFISLELVGGFGLPYDLDETYRRITDLFIAGLHQS